MFLPIDRERLGGFWTNVMGENVLINLLGEKTVWGLWLLMIVTDCVLCFGALAWSGGVSSPEVFIRASEMLGSLGLIALSSYVAAGLVLGIAMFLDDRFWLGPMVPPSVMLCIGQGFLGRWTVQLWLM